MSEVRGQRSEIRGQRADVRDQRSEIRDQGLCCPAVNGLGFLIILPIILSISSQKARFDVGTAAVSRCGNPQLLEIFLRKGQHRGQIVKSAAQILLGVNLEFGNFPGLLFSTDPGFDGFQFPCGPWATSMLFLN